MLKTSGGMANMASKQVLEEKLSGGVLGGLLIWVLLEYKNIAYGSQAWGREGMALQHVKFLPAKWLFEHLIFFRLEPLEGVCGDDFLVNCQKYDFLEIGNVF